MLFARFVDIGRILDYHRLNFFSIMSLADALLLLS